jgi:hypothetical protein
MLEVHVTYALEKSPAVDVKRAAPHDPRRWYFYQRAYSTWASLTTKLSPAVDALRQGSRIPGHSEGRKYARSSATIPAPARTSQRRPLSATIGGCRTRSRASRLSDLSPGGGTAAINGNSVPSAGTRRLSGAATRCVWRRSSLMKAFCRGDADNVYRMSLVDGKLPYSPSKSNHLCDRTRRM